MKQTLIYVNVAAFCHAVESFFYELKFCNGSEGPDVLTSQPIAFFRARRGPDDVVWYVKEFWPT